MDRVTPLRAPRGPGEVVLKPKLLLGAFFAWTGLVWLSRIRNVVRNDELDGTGKVVRVVVSLVFLALLAATLLRRRRPDGAHWFTGLVAWTVGAWLVLGIGMLVDDHSVGFKVIHTVLAVISIGLALAAFRYRPARA